MNPFNKFSILFLAISLATCQTPRDLNQEIIEEVNKEIDRYVLESKEYWNSHFENILPSSSEQFQPLIDSFLIEPFIEKVHEEVRLIVNSLNLSESESQKLLKCLTSEDNYSGDCLNRIGMIMTPIANFFMVEANNNNSYHEMIEHIVDETDLLRKDINPMQCLSLKMGNYYFVDPFDNDTTKIIRTSDTQLEISAQDSLVFSVVWEDDCTYRLTPNIGSSDTIVTYEIINRKESGYRFISRGFVKGKLVVTDIGIVEQ